MGSPHPPHVPEGLLCAGDTVVTPASRLTASVGRQTISRQRPTEQLGPGGGAQRHTPSSRESGWEGVRKTDEEMTFRSRF